MTATFMGWGLGYDWAWFWATIIGILVIALPLMLAVAMVIYAERKIWAAIALRRGPNVVGPWGLLQSFADGLKVFLKETIIPTSANKGLFLIAPIVTFTVALIVAVGCLASELVFRAFLVELGHEFTKNYAVAVVVAALAEALLAEGDPAVRVGAGVFSVGLGWMYVASGRSILAPLCARLVFSLGALVLEALRVIG